MILLSCLLIGSVRLISNAAPCFLHCRSASRFTGHIPQLSSSRWKMSDKQSDSQELVGAGADVWLMAKGVKFDIIIQNEATGKCRDSALQRGLSLRQIVKSIVFVESCVETSGARYLQAMVPGNLQVSSRKLITAVGSEWKMVEKDELLAVTGCIVGAVHPFVKGVCIRLLDERLMKLEAISFNTGDMTKGVVVSPEGLVTALGEQVRIVDIAADELSDQVEAIAEEWGLESHDARFVLDTPGILEYLESYVFALRQALGTTMIWPVGVRSDEDTHPMFWLRQLARFAGQAKVELSRVPPEWLTALARAGSATKYAREMALKTYIATAADPGIPAAAAQTDDDQVGRVLEQVLAAQRQFYLSSLRDIAAGGPGDEKRRTKLVTFLMGEAMKASAGSLSPKQLRAALLARVASDMAAPAPGP